jgi:hypothetical protein
MSYTQVLTPIAQDKRRVGESEICFKVFIDTGKGFIVPTCGLQLGCDRFPKCNNFVHNDLENALGSVGIISRWWGGRKGEFSDSQIQEREKCLMTQ